jgi:hypothetical protein
MAKHNWTKREQELVDIMFQVVIATTEDKVFCELNNEDKAKWLRNTLANCGFPTEPIGASWGVLKEELL